jgi:hypothetical protein
MSVTTIKKNTKKEVEKILKKAARKRKGNLKKHFGINPNEVDGLAFQKKVRAEWD